MFEWSSDYVLSCRMTDSQWNDLIDRVEQKFGLFERDTNRAENGEVVESLVFSSPMGKVKLTRTVRPRVIGEAATYSKRIGASVAVKKLYDQNDKVSFLAAYLWDAIADDWRELKDADHLSLI